MTSEQREKLELVLMGALIALTANLIRDARNRK
jgi:hypothetical protein